MSGKATPLYEVFPGRDFRGYAYRVTRNCPPQTPDFSSYEALEIRYDQRDFFKGTGVSMYRTPERAIEIGRRFAHGHSLATVDLDHEGVVWAVTGKRGHVTVWVAPATLLEQVVQCESYE
jgi:hypothetical protein